MSSLGGTLGSGTHQEQDPGNPSRGAWNAGIRTLTSAGTIAHPKWPEYLGTIWNQVMEDKANYKSDQASGTNRCLIPHHYQLCPQGPHIV